MHPNPAFRGASEQDNLAFARARAFGVLAVNGPDAPLAAHIPFELSADGKSATLHLARSNPIARAALPMPALLCVQGADHYISPDWYGSHQDVPDQVPTWNYIAVHLRGMLHPLPAEELEPHLERISAAEEARLLPKKPWTKEKMTDGAMARMMRAILPFRLEITAVDGTWKMNQNKPADVRLRAADHLAALGEETSAAALSRMMRKL